MAVNVEMWRPQIIEGLYKSNAFLKRAFDANDYVVGGRIVHIPQSGGGTTVQRNRTELPATITKRNDTDILYALDEFTTDPKLITDIDKKELSYDKRQSVIREETAYLMELVGNWMLYKWSSETPNDAAHRIETSGATGAGGLKIMTEADVLNLQVQFNKANVPADGRVLVLTSDHEGQLRSDDKLKYAFQQVVSLPDGVIGRLHGFDIYQRSSVIKLAANGTVKTPDAAAAVGDVDASMAYHESFVERALGSVDMFDNPNRAEYYGDIVSFLIRMGGRFRRADNKGIGLIVPKPA